MHPVGAEPDEVTQTKSMSVVGPDMALARGHQGTDSYVYCRQGLVGNLQGVEASSLAVEGEISIIEEDGLSHQPVRFRANIQGQSKIQAKVLPTCSPIDFRKCPPPTNISFSNSHVRRSITIYPGARHGRTGQCCLVPRIPRPTTRPPNVIPVPAHKAIASCASHIAALSMCCDVW